MSVRQTRFALPLAVALTAMTLFVGGRVNSVDVSSGRATPRAPHEIRTGPGSGEVVLTIEQDRHDGESPERPLSLRLLLLAFVTSLVPLASFACRRLTPRRAPRLHALLWSARTGRSPPLLVTAIA